MEGAYLAHAVYGFFQNGGGLCWVVRVGAGDGAAARPQAALPAAADKSIEAFRAVALEGVDGAVEVELTEEPDAPARTPTPTYKLVVDAGTAGKEEYEGLTLKKGRSNIATKVNAASKLIKINETAGLPDSAPGAPARTRSRRPASPAEEVKATDFEGDVARRQGMGGLAAVDEITMVCMPDLMTLGADGDDVAAARPAGQDDRPLRGRRRPHGDPRRAAGPDRRRRSSSGG